MSNQQEIQNELEGIAPLLNKIHKAPVQQIPESYFEKFSAPIPQQPNKVIARFGFNKWIMYASAAAIAGILVTSVLQYTDKKSNSFDYEQYNKINITEELSKLSDEELQDYLVSVSETSATINYIEEE